MRKGTETKTAPAKRCKATNPAIRYYTTKTECADICIANSVTQAKPSQAVVDHF